MIEQSKKIKQILKTMTVCENCKNCTYKDGFPYCLLENKYKGLYQSCNKFKQKDIYIKSDKRFKICKIHLIVNALKDKT